jgi:hypothetical protein
MSIITGRVSIGADRAQALAVTTSDAKIALVIIDRMLCMAGCLTVPWLDRTAQSLDGLAQISSRGELEALHKPWSPINGIAPEERL